MAQSLVVALTAKLDTLATLPGNLYAPESGISHITTISFTLISLCIAFAYVILIDIRKGYVTPPKHFPKWTLKEAMFKPNVDVPIVRPNPGSKDFSEVLERGARLVSKKGNCGDTSDKNTAESGESNSTLADLSRCHTTRMNGSSCHMP